MEVAIEAAGPTSTRQKYVAVNGAWPVPRSELPPLSAAVARRAFKVLWRHRFGEPFKGRLRGNNRTKRTYGSKWSATIGHNSGWWVFVHDLSHLIHRLQYPHQSAHRASAHAAVERDLIEEVVRRGWLEEKPVVKVAAPTDKLSLELARTDAAIKRWQTKEKRAHTALRKLTAKRHRLGLRVRYRDQLK